MSRERIAIAGLALAFYVVGGWSLYGAFHPQHHTLGYKYIGRTLQRQVKYPAVARLLTQSHSGVHAARPAYKPEDPVVAVAVGNPRYTTGLGLIGFGTLLALCRELILRRRGKFRGDTVPIAWQGLIEALKKPL